MRAIHYFGALGVLAFTVSVLAAPGNPTKVSPRSLDGTSGGQTLPGGPLNTTMSPANNCDAPHALGILGSAGGYFSGDTYYAGNDFEGTGFESCSYAGDAGSGHDEIWEFFVDADGRWTFDTCSIPAQWDTSLGLWKDIGIGCNGIEMVCDGDGCDSMTCGQCEGLGCVGVCSGGAYVCWGVGGCPPGETCEMGSNFGAPCAAAGGDPSCDNPVMGYCWDGGPSCGENAHCVGWAGETCGPGACWESAIEDVCLQAGAKYWLVVDGYSPTYAFPGTYYDVSYSKTTPACVDDAECDDGDICNGVEVCTLGCCIPGDDFCEVWEDCEGEVPNQYCVNNHPQCYTWLSNIDSPSFYPRANQCPEAYGVFGMALADDIELLDGAGRELLSYYLEVHARDFAGAPIGVPYNVEAALWTNSDDESCLPNAPIVGTECDFSGVIMPSSSDADVVLCEPAGGMPTGIMLPDRSGDVLNCEVDFFMWYRADYDGVGFGIAGGSQVIGGMAATDDYGGTDVFFQSGGDDCVAPEAWGAGTFGMPLAGFMAAVCTVPSGPCCHPDGGCSEETQASCDALGGIMGGLSDPSNPMSCDDWEADIDGDGYFYGCDNCPDTPNPAQRDCDGDHSCVFDPDTKLIVCEGEGDLCEPDFADQDKDLDGCCNGVDGCPNDPVKCEPEQCGCGEDELDKDGDCDGPLAECQGHCMDCVDECPNDPGACVLDAFCGCPLTPYDWDNDGVPNCDDLCPGVDDATFGPDCRGMIPTVSEWGLVVLALLLLVAGKVYFGRRKVTA